MPGGPVPEKIGAVVGMVSLYTKVELLLAIHHSQTQLSEGAASGQRSRAWGLMNASGRVHLFCQVCGKRRVEQVGQ